MLVRPEPLLPAALKGTMGRFSPSISWRVLCMAFGGAKR